MESRSSQTNTLLLVLILAVVLGGGLYYYNNYSELRADGPMERAGEKLDNVMDGK